MDWQELLIALGTILLVNIGLVTFMSQSFNKRFDSLESSLNKRVDDLREQVTQLRTDTNVRTHDSPFDVEIQSPDKVRILAKSGGRDEN